MAEIHNLRRERRRAGRKEAAREAEANRARFGRTVAEKDRDALDQARRRAVLDGARLERSGPDTEAEPDSIPEAEPDSIPE